MTINLLPLLNHKGAHHKSTFLHSFDDPLLLRVDQLPQHNIICHAQLLLILTYIVTPQSDSRSFLCWKFIGRNLDQIKLLRFFNLDGIALGDRNPIIIFLHLNDIVNLQFPSKIGLQKHIVLHPSPIILATTYMDVRSFLHRIVH